MTTTVNRYDGDGTTTDFTFSFDYLSQSYVTFTVKNAQGTDVTSDYSGVMLDSTTYQITPAPSTGTKVEIKRSTAITDDLFAFATGAVIRPNDLSQAMKTLRDYSEESVDQIATATLNAQSEAVSQATATANSYASTATTKASEAAASESTATTKASEAATSASDASTSAASASVAVSSAQDAQAAAETAQTGAETAQAAAETAQTAAEGAKNEFFGVYLGTFANDTAVTGTPDVGDLYYNSTATSLKIYNGSAWVEAASSQDAADTIAAKNEFFGIYKGTSSSAPSGSHDAGDLYFDTTDNEIKVYTGSAWTSVSTTSTSTAAEASKVAAETAKTAAEAALKQLLNKYHGAFASDSAVQTAISNDSDLSLEQGDLYFNTTQNALRYYDGSAWYNAASTNVIDTSNLVNVGDVSYSGIATDDLLVRTANGWTNTTFADLMVSLNAKVFTSADHSKLDGIEAGATGDLTGAEIKLAYESQADTNAFTNTLQTKLEGIEAGADVTVFSNVQAAGALMDSELASESAVKGINQALTTTSDVDFKDLTLSGDLGANKVCVGTTSAYPSTVSGAVLSSDGYAYLSRKAGVPLLLNRINDASGGTSYGPIVYFQYGGVSKGQIDILSDDVEYKDASGNVRKPRYTSLTGTTATLSDEGVYYTTSVTSCTLGSPVAGTVMTIYNDSASDITLYKGSTLQTMRIGADNDGSNGGNKGSVTLAPNSTTTITMFAANFAVVTGTDVS